MSIRLQSLISTVVVALVVVFVFEEWIYGRLNLAGQSYLIAKVASESFLYCLLLLLVADRLAQGKLAQYRPSYFDLVLFMFLALAALSTILNDGSLMDGALNVRTMLRFTSIYYIIVLSGWIPTERQLRQLISVLVAIAIVQSILITSQHIAGDEFRDSFFAGVETKVEIYGIERTAGVMEAKKGAGFGTFGKTPLAAFFLLLVATVCVAAAQCLSGTHRRKWWLAFGVIFVGILFTYKRAPLLLAVLIPVIVAWFAGNRQFSRRYVIAVAIVVPVILLFLITIRPAQYIKEKETQINPVESFAQLFSSDYWTITATKARGWVILEVAEEALGSFKPLGYGPDEDNAKSKLATKGGEFSKLVGWGALDDVYIVACLVYYGPVGVVLLVLAFYYLYRQGILASRLASNCQDRFLGVCLGSLLIVMLLSVFVVRLLEFRSFAFLFWTLAGIVVATLQRPKQLFIKSTREYPSHTVIST
jgi:hypothetical protein